MGFSRERLLSRTRTDERFFSLKVFFIMIVSTCCVQATGFGVGSYTNSSRVSNCHPK